MLSVETSVLRVESKVDQLMVQITPVQELTLREYALDQKIEMTLEQSQEFGRQVSAAQRKAGYSITRTPGTKNYPNGINRYRLDVLQSVMTSMKGDA
jgi:hypothetical protein